MFHRQCLKPVASPRIFFVASSLHKRILLISAILTVLIGITNIPVAAQSTGITTRVSVDSHGKQGAGSNLGPAISGYGRFVAFHSFADNLVSDDTNGTWDVFLADRETGSTTRISVASDGSQGNGTSQSPSLTADGRLVVFHSYATNLVMNDTNGKGDIFIHDRLTGSMTRVSVASDGAQADDSSLHPSISADGRYVAFESLATNLVSDDTNGQRDIFVRDLQTESTTRVSVASDGTQSNGASYPARISANGRYVSFASAATTLVHNDTNGVPDIFVHDLQTDSTLRVSVASDGSQANAISYAMSISADGRYIAFESLADNLVSGVSYGIYVYDQQTATTTHVVAGSEPDISADGRYVAFESGTDMVSAGDTNNQGDVFLYDRQADHITLVSQASNGTQADDVSSAPVVSADGRFVTFESDATTLVENDTNGTTDVFVRDLDPNAIFTISGSITDSSGDPVEGVTLTAENGRTAHTDATGTYSMTRLMTGTYTVTPTLTGYVFDPITRTVSVPPDATHQVFTATTSLAQYHTLILTNRARMAALFGETAASDVMLSLNQLAAHSSVNGLVIQVEHDPAVAAAYDTWVDSDQVEQANAVSDAIKQVIARNLNTYPALEYIVIAGDDRVIPFRRAVDRVPSVQNDGYIVTDDFYADRIPALYRGEEVYIPDLSIGRLVESPEQVIAQINTFLSNAELTIGSSIVTGYDFLVDSAQSQCAIMQADALTADCTLANATGTDAAFKAGVVNSYHDLVSLNGLASSSYIQGGATDGDFLNSGVDFARAIFYSVGSHAGQNVPDDGDFPEALSGEQHATYMANTGYGWGGDGIAFSEEVMHNVTQELLRGTASTPGRALMQAKQRYAADNPGLGGYHEKVLMQVTLYGLPMYQIQTPAAFPPAADRSVPNEQRVPLTADLARESRTFDLQMAPPIYTAHGSFYTLDGTVVAEAGTPVQPRLTQSVHVIGDTAHGVVFTGGTYEVVTQDPVIQQAITTSHALTETLPLEPAFMAPDWYPSIFFTLNRVELDAANLEQIVSATGQYNPNLSADNQRIYTQMHFDTFYSRNADDWIKPTVVTMDSTLQGNTATVSVDAIDNTGIYTAVVAYTEGEGTWYSVPLTPSATVWTGHFLATETTDFFLQVVDEAGNVSVVHKDHNQYFHPGDTYQVLHINGPARGVMNTSQTFTATVGLTSSTNPITYVWTLAGQAPVTHTSYDLHDTLSASWALSGTQTITATVTDGIHIFTDTHTITISNSLAPRLHVDVSVSALISVTVTNQIGARVPNEPVTFHTDDATVLPASTLTDAQGVAMVIVAADDPSSTVTTTITADGIMERVMMRFADITDTVALYLPLIEP